MQLVHENLRELLQYFHFRSIENDPGRFDSRIVRNFVSPGYTKSHAEWIAFIKEAKTLLAQYGELDLRTSPGNEEFAMLTMDQVSILLCFDAMTLDADKSITLRFKRVLACVNYYRRIDPATPIPSKFGLFIGFLGMDKDKTLEETKKRKETPLKKEKRLEREFGEKLTAQGVAVQYQVPCEHGIADIVTPDAIYEVKASLSRSTMHKAISQVLLYRNCLNPSAKAVVIGCPHRKQPVDIEMARSLGVEVIVLEDQIDE